MGFKAICFQIVKLFRFHISLKHTELRVLSTYYIYLQFAFLLLITLVIDSSQLEQN